MVAQDIGKDKAWRYVGIVIALLGESLGGFFVFLMEEE